VRCVRYVTALKVCAEMFKICIDIGTGYDILWA
jgi:hypothetical protein